MDKSRRNHFFKFLAIGIILFVIGFIMFESGASDNIQVPTVWSGLLLFIYGLSGFLYAFFCKAHIKIKSQLKSRSDSAKSKKSDKIMDSMLKTQSLFDKGLIDDDMYEKKMSQFRSELNQ